MAGLAGPSAWTCPSSCRPFEARRTPATPTTTTTIDILLRGLLVVLPGLLIKVYCLQTWLQLLPPFQVEPTRPLAAPGSTGSFNLHSAEAPRQSLLSLGRANKRNSSLLSCHSSCSACSGRPHGRPTFERQNGYSNLNFCVRIHPAGRRQIQVVLVTF